MSHIRIFITIENQKLAYILNLEETLVKVLRISFLDNITTIIRSIKGSNKPLNQVSFETDPAHTLQSFIMTSFQFRRYEAYSC